MPPVRWKDITILIISASIVQQIASTKSPNIAESYSIVANGWTPIIGHKNRGDNNGEITMYRNPASKSSEPVKAEKLHHNMKPPILASLPNNVNVKNSNQQKSPNHLYHLQPHQIHSNSKNGTSSQSSNKPIIAHGITHNVNTITSGPSLLGGKIPPHSKPLLLLQPSSHSHGPHIPLSSANTPIHRPSSPKNTLPLGPQMNKHHHHHYQHSHGHHPHGHGPTPLKRPHIKPPIVVPPPQLTRQVGAHSTRDEVFLPAPQQIGAFGFFNQQNPTQIKTRITQPHGHIEFANHFGISPSSDQNHYPLSRMPIQQYIVPKHPTLNDVHYAYHQSEDFTRNLVPPPIYSFDHEQVEKQKSTKPIYKQHDSVTEVYHQHQQQQQEKKKQNQFVGNYASPEKTVDVQVTKEQLKVYHSNLPNTFNIPSDYEFGSYQTINHNSDAPKLATYEVTEGKQWQETQPYYQPFTTRAPHKSRRPQHVPIDDKPFLPTPFKPEHLQPTIATQSEISTIYNQLSHRNKHRDNFNPSFFSVMEVSTHFPIVGQPGERPDFITQPPQISYTTDPPPDITKTNNFDFVLQADEETTIPPTRPPNRSTVTRKRPQQRRRRPGIRNRYQPVEEADAITESIQKVQEPESEETTEKNRFRRPNRYRTTESPLIEKEDEKMSAIRSRNRYKTTTSTEQSIVETTNRQIGDEDEEEVLEHERFIPQVVTEKDFPESFEDQFKSNVYYKTESYQPTTSPSQEIKRLKPNFSESLLTEDEFKSNILHPKPTDLSDVTIYEPNKAISTKEEQFTEPTYEIRKSIVEELYNNDKKEFAPPNNIMKVEDFQSSTEKSRFQANLPENEIDYTTILSNNVESATAMDIYKEHKIATTTTESTTSAVTRPSRVRGRPAPIGNRFETNRPRFSVKDYRQRSTTSTTEVPAARPANFETSTRIRFPNRSRRPLTTSTTTQNIDDESTEKNKSYKHPSNSKDENESSFAEKHYRGNTRRPFGRNRSTTEAATIKLSIKPNIFTNLKRPTPISLRNRILNRQNKTTTIASTTTPEVLTTEEANETDSSETTLDSTDATTTTEFGAKKTVDDIDVANKEDISADILKNESFMYSQRVSDLTSSSKNEYSTPGRFKNVPTSSRRVPSYFTLATDEPILPIQAFFPNIKDKS